jgi:hypothetical protein
LPINGSTCYIYRSRTLREEQRLKVSENRMLKRIFGPKRGEVTGGWRELRNEELHNLYSSPGIIGMTKLRRMRFDRGRRMNREKTNV